MAFSISAAQTTVFGNERVWQGVVTADAASGVVSFGLKTLTHVGWSQKSMTTALAKVRLNALADGTASQGDLGISGVASGDELFVTVYGR